MAQAGRTDVMTEERAGVGAGWVLFAGIMMIVGGFFASFEGLGALLKSGRFYAGWTDYPFGANITTWGWIMLIGGILVLLAGFAVMREALWARIVGITPSRRCRPWRTSSSSPSTRSGHCTRSSRSTSW